MSPNFHYHVRDMKGTNRDGMIEALNEDDAVKKLQKQGLIIISVNVVISKSFLSEIKKNLLLVGGLLFPTCCFKCKKKLEWLSIKTILNNKFICSSCFEATKEGNGEIIDGIIRKYLENKNQDFRESMKVINNSVSIIGLEPYSLDKAKEFITNNLKNLKVRKASDNIDELFAKKKLNEDGLAYLDDLEKITKLIKSKGVNVDFLTTLSLITEEINTEFDRLKAAHQEEVYSIINNLVGKNHVDAEQAIRIYKQNVQRDVPNIIIRENPLFLENVIKILEKFGFVYTKEQVASLINKVEEEDDLKAFENNLNVQQTGQSLGDFTNLDGHQFEEYDMKLFELLGYTVIRTPLTGDQGADLIISKDGIKTVVQAKKYEGTVSNKAIQEAVAAKTYYKAEKAMVVTNSSFTKGAIDLALANGVELWDGQKLEKIIKDLKIPKEEKNLFGCAFDYRMAIDNSLCFLCSTEELEIFKIIMTKFLDLTLNLESLVFQEPSVEFIEKRRKFESSSEYVYLINYSKKIGVNSSEYKKDILKLQELLRNKGLNFDTEELNRLSLFEERQRDYLIFKKLMLSYPASSLRDYLENFVIIYGDEVFILRDFRRVHSYIAQNNYSNPRDRLRELEKEGVNIKSFEHVMCFISGREINFDSERNAQQFIIAISVAAVLLISYLKKLLTENKVDIEKESGKQLNDEELIKMILKIKYSEIEEYNAKKSSLGEFKVLNNTVFPLDLISFLESETKEDALKEMVNLFTQAGMIKNDEKFYQNIIEAEKIMNTALGQNIAIPNASSDVSENMLVAVGVSRRGIDFNSLDGSLVKLVFMVAWNDEIFKNDPVPRIKILAEISRFLKDESIRESLINTSSRHETFLILKNSFQRKQ